MNENTRKKALIVQKVVRELYQPERQDKCKLWVYRNHINPVIPMTKRTFWRYLKIDAKETKKAEDDRQLKLF